MRPAPSSNRRCSAAQGRLETRSQSTPSHRHHPAPRAIKTQPLSNCVVGACAYQRTRQRNMRIAKTKLPRLLTTIWHRKTIWKTSFQTNPQELSTLCIYPKQLLNTKNVSIKKTLFISTLAQYFILQLRKNIPLTTMTLIVFCFGNHAMERNASPPIQDLERHLLEHLLLNLYML